MTKLRLFALIAILTIAVVGSILIVIIPHFEPPAQVESTFTRLTVFLGPIISFLIGFVTINRSVDAVDKKVNGHLQRVTTALVSAVADHPDIAVKAEQVGLTLPTTPVEGDGNDTHS